jgi:predicted nicotinamide N-methyase
VDDAERLIHEYTAVQVVPLAPEFRLWLAKELLPLWQATESRAGRAQAPPFWAFVWPGSQVLARYLIDTPSIVRGKRVLDFGAGGGLAAIAAVQVGATDVVACDADPLALVAQGMNAALNGVTFERRCGDCAESDFNVDVVLAGDVCYEREAAARTLAWLRRAAEAGADVLLADPGRHYAPTDGVELLGMYDVPTLKELESADTKRTRLWRMQRRSTSVR